MNIAVQVNLKSLSSKLSWNELKKHSLFTEAYNTDSTWIKNFLDSPAVSGIDTDKGIFFFVQKENNGGYIAIEGSIKDEAAFKIFCTRLASNTAIKEEAGIQYITRFPDCVGWNDKQFIFVMDAPEMQQMDELNRRMQQDSIDISNHSPRDVAATCKSLFELEEKKSLAANDKFGSLLKEEGDLHVWANTEVFYRDVKLPDVLGMINLEKFYKESITTAVVNFEKGRIKVNAHSFSNAALSKVFEKFAGGKVSEAMLRKLPGENVVAALAINFKPEALLEIAKVINLDGIINTYSPALGFTTNDFIKANKGDIVFGVSDLTMVADSIPATEMYIPFTMYKPAFNTVFAAAVADKNSFDKLYNTGNKAAAMFLNTQGYPLFTTYNNNYFVMGNTKANADAFINATPDKNHDFVNAMAGSSVAGYINLQSLIKGLTGKDSSSSVNRAMYDASLKLWDNMLLKGGDFANGALNYSLEINMMDKNTNSLQQLNTYATVMSNLIEQQRKKELEDMRTMQDAFPDEVIPKTK